MKDILDILKRTLTKHWKELIVTLLATLVTIAVALLLRELPTVRLSASLAATSIFVILLLWLFPKWQMRSVSGLEPKDRFDRENEARKTLSQILGGLVLLIGFYFTWQNLKLARDSQAEAQKGTQENLRIAQEGQITDRFAKAIAQLGEVGDEKLAVRLGGIYALERIANDKTTGLHWAIMEVLTAFVREHTKIVKFPKYQSEHSLIEGQPPRPSLDVQAILTVLGRRDTSSEDPKKQWLNLHETDLRGADLDEGDFSNADFRRANLSQADLTGAKLGAVDFTLAVLQQADVRDADLRSAKFYGANLFAADLSSATLKGAFFVSTGVLGSAAILEAADFSNTDLSGTRFNVVDLREAIFDQANLSGVDFDGADLRGTHFRYAKGLLSDQLETTKGDTWTALPPNIPRPKAWR